MENIKESVAYLQGLTRGLQIDEDTAEGKIIVKMLDVMEDMAADVAELRSSQAELEEYVVAIDGDLSDLEEDVYDDFGECNEDFIELQCPSCKREVSFNSTVLESRHNLEIACPYCGSIVYDNIIDGDCAYENDVDYENAGNPGI